MNIRCNGDSWRSVAAALLVWLTLLAGGCATDSFREPPTFDVSALRERAEVAVEGNVVVFAAVPSLEESETIFGIDLSKKSIQPVWIEIDNQTDGALHFLRTGLDSEYFSPREVAFAFGESLSDEGKKRLIQHIERLDFRNPIGPRSTASGFVFTNESPGTKFVSVDVLGERWSSHVKLMAPVPERSISSDRIAKIHERIAETESLNIETESKLRARLERLPCCASGATGIQSLPLNVVLIGKLAAVGPALLRRGFRYEPVSPLYVFGRPQDISGRKVGGWVAAQPHVLRMWLADFRFQGQLVWVGQISTPLGGRFADPVDDEALRIMDPDVDAVRLDLIQDMLYSQLVTDIGHVKGVGSVSKSSPRKTPGGSKYFTDGLRAVLMFDSNPTSLTEIEVMRWERLSDPRHQ